jgi:hypothetical protein
MANKFHGPNPIRYRERERGDCNKSLPSSVER